MSGQAFSTGAEDAAAHGAALALARLHPLLARTVPPTALDARARATAFDLFRRVYDGADRARFERDLDEKQLVILLEDGATGRIRGFSTVLVRPIDVGSGRATVVFSGDTVIDPACWGQKRLQSAFARLLLELKLREPRRPLFWLLISKGYRTYLLLANAFPRAVPRGDRPDDPGLASLRDVLATERFGAEYDAARGIVRYASPHERVRAGLAPVTGELLANPHVRFFVERNPRHTEGEELVCLAEVRLVDLARVAVRTLHRRAALRLGLPTPRGGR